MTKLSAGLLTLGLLLGVGGTLHAQTSVAAEAALADDVDFGVGAAVVIPLAQMQENLEFAGRFNVFFPDGLDYWEINGDLRYHFPLPDNDRILPYFLGGAGIGNFSSDADVLEDDDSNTEFGLRIGGGLKFPSQRLMPFVEAAGVIGDLPDFVFRGGVSFILGS